MKIRQRVIITLEVFIIGLLMYMAHRMGIVPQIDVPQALKDFFNDGYVANIICSVLSLLLVYYCQLAYCKFRLKRDFRFNEALTDLYSANSDAKKLLSKWNKTDSLKFYRENKSTIKLIHDEYLYPNNSIVWDSINTVFFLNINFKLLGIVNNIKNRLPTMDRLWQDVSQEDESITDRTVDLLFMDIEFLSEYCDDLFDYFNFDLSLQQKTAEYIPMGPLEFMKLSHKQQIKLMMQARRKAKKELRKKEK